VFHKSILHGMEIVGTAEPFDGRDLGILLHCGERQATIDSSAIHMDRARAALAVVAAFLRSGQMDGLAERIK
jgi:hypothetical protein